LLSRVIHAVLAAATLLAAAGPTSPDSVRVSEKEVGLGVMLTLSGNGSMTGNQRRLDVCAKAR
jgi:hypothetical protein